MRHQIITFYEFKPMSGLRQLQENIFAAMAQESILGTVIIASEGYNGSVCGEPDSIVRFAAMAGHILGSAIDYKTSFNEQKVFQRRKVKIKPEIIALGKTVDMELGRSTHVDFEEWNAIIADPETVVLDTRNDYEYQVGTFRNAINPQTLSFKQLPDFAEEHLDPKRHKRIAMFCTGGIRCEKFAPYLKQKGFDQVFQLHGGILRYLEEVRENESLWQGECFVFDERISVDEMLETGSADDLSPAAKSVKRNG